MNASVRELVVRGMRALLRTSLWWGGGIAAFTLLNLAFWPSMEGSEALAELETMSPELLAAFGAQNIGSPAGYLDGQLYALLFPLLFSAMAIAAASAITAGDEESGRLELLHALPLSRQEVWLARFGASMLALAAVVAVVLALVCITLVPFSLDEAGFWPVTAATAACGLLAAFHAAVAYAMGAARGSRGAAVGASVVVLAAGYAANFLFPLVSGLEELRKISPWYWAIGEQPVTNGIDLAWLSLLIVATALLVTAGTFAIGRRDLRSA